MRALDGGVGVEVVNSKEQKVNKWCRPVEMFKPHSEAFKAWLHNWKTVDWSLAMFLLDRELEFVRWNSKTQMMLRRSMDRSNYPQMIPLGAALYTCLDGYFVKPKKISIPVHSGPRESEVFPWNPIFIGLLPWTSGSTGNWTTPGPMSIR